MGAQKLKFRLLATTCIAGLTLALSACSSSSPDSTAGNFAQEIMEDSDFAVSSMVESMADSADSVDYADQDAAIIKTGYLQVRVKDTTVAVSEAVDLVAALGGSTENRYEYRDEDGSARSAEVTFKVPSKDFDAAITQISTLGKIIEDNRSASDVTLERTDLRARVAVLETSIERLTAMLEDADTTSDLIEIELALSDRQQDLDALTAQLNYLDDQVSFSRITVYFSTDRILESGPDSFWSGIVAGFNSLLKAATAAFIGFGVAIPWLIAAGIIVVIIWGLIAAIRKRKAS